MASPKHRQYPEEPDLITQSDFQLLNSLTNLVSKENSQSLKAVAWEIMRRYSDFLSKPEPTRVKDYISILGDARWGDAKRVEVIFGLKRGVLDRLSKADKIKSKALDEDRKNAGDAPAVRAKRLYNLISISEYLESDK